MQLERANQAHASSRVAAFCFERATDPGYPSPVAALRPGADVLTEERGGRDAVAARGGLRRSPAAAANRPRAARLSRLQLPSRPAPSPSLSVPAAAPRRCSPPTVGGASAGEAASRASLPNVRWWPGWQRSAPSCPEYILTVQWEFQCHLFSNQYSITKRKIHSLAHFQDEIME